MWKIFGIVTKWMILMHFDMMMLVLILEARDYARNSEMEDAIIWPLVEEQMSSSSI